MNIFLSFLEKPVKGKCAISGKKVAFSGLLGFFVENDKKKPVATNVALKQGFTMTKEVLNKLEQMIENGQKYQEVQESAHHEFEKLK